MPFYWAVVAAARGTVCPRLVLSCCLSYSSGCEARIGPEKPDGDSDGKVGSVGTKTSFHDLEPIQHMSYFIRRIFLLTAVGSICLNQAILYCSVYWRAKLTPINSGEKYWCRQPAKYYSCKYSTSVLLFTIMEMTKKTRLHLCSPNKEKNRCYKHSRRPPTPLRPLYPLHAGPIPV